MSIQWKLKSGTTAKGACKSWVKNSQSEERKIREIAQRSWLKRVFTATKIAVLTVRQSIKMSVNSVVSWGRGFRLFQIPREIGMRLSGHLDRDRKSARSP